jgi:hypothetical protein
MTDKIRIVKETIQAKSRKLSATWTYEDIPDRISRIKPVKNMTKEEEADEIIRRLSQPYRTPEEEMWIVMSEAITKEIDNEIMKSLVEWQKKNPNI